MRNKSLKLAVLAKLLRTIVKEQWLIMMSYRFNDLID